VLNQQAGKKDFVKAGVTVIAGLCILGLFIIAFGGHRFWEALDTYIIRFNGVKNLEVGRPVKYAGINVGRVLEIEVDNDNPALVRVVVGLREGFTVYEGTRASISQKGIVGDNFVLLNLSGKAGPALRPGSLIPPEAAPDFMEVASAMASVATELKPKLAEIADSLRELLKTDNRRQIEDILAQMATLVHNADTVLKEFGSVAGEAGKGIRETRALVGEVRQGLGSTMTSLNSAIEGVHGDTTQTLAVLRTQVAAVGGALTALSGQLQRDLDYDQNELEEILDNTAELTHNLKVLTQSLKERPWQVIYRPDDRQME